MLYFSGHGSSLFRSSSRKGYIIQTSLSRRPCDHRYHNICPIFTKSRLFTTSSSFNRLDDVQEKIISKDPRLADLGRTFSNEYSVIREQYSAPTNPIVLCHGLLGFDELRLAGELIPGIAYWRGIKEALRAVGADVITTAVPASGSIEVRATSLLKQIEAKAPGSRINLIGHSMVG